MDGANAADFLLVAAPPPFLEPTQQAAFTIGFRPSIAANRSAALHIGAIGLPDTPLDFSLSGLGLSKANDTDGDGRNDAAEFELSALGFNWQLGQPAEVATLLDGTFQMDLFAASQIQLLSPGNPVIRKNSATGKFDITLDWKRSQDLAIWQDFPLSPAAIAVDPSGDLKVELPGAGNTEFFLLKVE